MVKSGIPPSQYAPTLYAPSMYGQPVYGGPPGIPMLPMPGGVAGPPSNGYGRDYDGASSGLKQHFKLNNLAFALTKCVMV